jgi:hypothetical protein
MNKAFLKLTDITQRELDDHLASELTDALKARDSGMAKIKILRNLDWPRLAGLFEPLEHKDLCTLPRGLRLDIEPLRRHPGGSPGNLPVSDAVRDCHDGLQKRALDVVSLATNRRPDEAARWRATRARLYRCDLERQLVVLFDLRLSKRTEGKSSEGNARERNSGK